MKKFFLLLMMVFWGTANPLGRAQDMNLERLSPEHVEEVETILAKLEPLIEARRSAGDLARLSFVEMEAPLTAEEREFLMGFRTFDPIAAGITTRWQGLSEGVPDLVRLDDQVVRRNGREEKLSPQFVPAPVYAAYERMMDAMERDTGRRLLIDSGYRSSAYQLYLFLFYMRNHDYSILETARWNAFPGYSEHGNPANQALDFISVEGITGEDDPQDFVQLPEYQWLMKRAGEFGFELSFPENDPTGIAFEPWHWRYVAGNEAAAG